ncbi:sterol desaturase family protein [Gimibacter soli]|uniref:Sterol desaturase family protein n=1 Tax=Gimibacter soli TaxID=3024400 RepID=A0AAE9XSG9_9PROT|nr:sterol desaturase family protein [Gimibacter soli]WCL53225.1 sterol desaturase family protein [Gimibacter soli]
MRFSFLKQKSHYLDKMTIKELVVAFFGYYAVQVYLVLAAVSLYVAFTYGTSLLMGLAAAAIAIALYPLSWYITHRWILHGQWLYKNPLTAPLWKRIHYDHHQDPHHLEVLFGALYTTLPAIGIVTIPAGYYLDGIGGAGAGFAAGVLWTCFYEFCHCIQHLNYKPKNAFLKHMKEQHMMHHFHDEDGNYGITSFFWDKLFGTYYLRKERPVKSTTVFNLGYTEEVAAVYPWVANLSGGVDDRRPREKRDGYKSGAEDTKAAE